MLFRSFSFKQSFFSTLINNQNAFFICSVCEPVFFRTDLKYTLAYAPVQTRNVGDSEYKPVEYVVFATGTQPVSGGVLGVFDPTLLPNGYYTVRLTVEAGGAPATKEITVSVEGELKVGSFSMSFIDMDMPIGRRPARASGSSLRLPHPRETS